MTTDNQSQGDDLDYDTMMKQLQETALACRKCISSVDECILLKNGDVNQMGRLSFHFINSLYNVQTFVILFCLLLCYYLVIITKIRYRYIKSMLKVSFELYYLKQMFDCTYGHNWN